MARPTFKFSTGICYPGKFSTGLLAAAFVAVTLAVSTVVSSQASAAILPATPSVDWSSAAPLQINSRLENPLVLFGFNPQPEPPPLGYIGPLLSITNGAARMTWTGASNPQDFVVFFGVSSTGGPIIVRPATPVSDFSSLFFGIDTGLQTLNLVLDFSTSSGGIGSGISAVAFNPQPEPPASVFGAYETFGLLFNFTSLSDAHVTMRVQDANDQDLAISGVPLPAGGALLAVAVAGLGWLGARDRQAH